MNKMKFRVAIFLALTFGVSHAVINGGSCDLQYLGSESLDGNNKLGTIEWVVDENSDGTKAVRFIKPEGTIASDVPTISPITKDVHGDYQISDSADSFIQMLAIKKYSGTHSGAFTIQNDQNKDSVARNYEVLYPAISNHNTVKQFRVYYNGTYKVNMDGTNLDSLTFRLKSSNDSYTGYDRPPRNIIYTIDVKNKTASRTYEYGTHGGVLYPITDEFNLVCK
ncbi:MAG TPA: hypothetical protein VKR58_02735 [Aquella sp.]|nr:hypothetical protein [Aquella sp.]